MTDDNTFRSNINDDNTRRSNIIDGIVRMLIVAKNGVYDKNADPKFDKFDVRSVAAMAIELYANPNEELVEKMNKLTTLSNDD